MQNMIITLIWIAPIMGVILSYGFTESAAPAPWKPYPPLAGTLDEVLPVQLHLAGMVPFNVEDHLTQHLPGGTGFPIMDWTALSAWANTAPNKADQERAFDLGVRAWLLHMKDVCQAPFRVYETAHAYILSPLDNGVVVATAAYIATTRKRISQVLSGVAAFAEGSKSILLVLHDEDAYYDYLAAYYPDGEFAMSSGVFINQGCPHFVVALADLAAIEPVIAHEMTHSAVHHLTLPRWLDEGLAVNTEQRLTRVPALIYSAKELRAKHLQYWGTSQIQEFWSGDSFFRTDDGNLLSYELARILVGHLSGDWEKFKLFLTNVKRSDAGAQAAQEQLDVNLGALVCALLERASEEDWNPTAALLEKMDGA